MIHSTKYTYTYVYTYISTRFKVTLLSNITLKHPRHEYWLVKDSRHQNTSWTIIHIQLITKGAKYRKILAVVLQWIWQTYVVLNILQRYIYWWMKHVIADFDNFVTYDPLVPSLYFHSAILEMYLWMEYLLACRSRSHLVHFCFPRY